jgi:pyrroline-5-carboxylate reductase
MLERGITAMGVFQSRTIFFLGAGSISEAILTGILAAQLLPPSQITISNRNHPEKLQNLQEKFGVHISQDKLADIAKADVVVLAIKPFDLLFALQEIAPAIKPSHLVISVVAGASSDIIERTLHGNIPVVRAMPNTSSVVQASATAISAGQWATEESILVVRELFTAIGSCVVVDESLLSAVTGLSGSGPAYIYYIAEALLEAGQSCGLDKDTCQQLLVQTIYGAGKMLQTTGRDPAELRKQVTSPKGTTMAGLEVIEQGGTKNILIQAVQRAAQRAQEMADAISEEANHQ